MNSDRRSFPDQIKTHQQSTASPASPKGDQPEAAGHQHHTYTILCTPRITSLCRRVLEDLGVSGDVELREYRLEWIGLEDDLLSLELEDVAKDIYLVSDSLRCAFHEAELRFSERRRYSLVSRKSRLDDVSTRIWAIPTDCRQGRCSKGTSPATQVILITRDADMIFLLLSVYTI
jgi:hypothetical protein